MGFDAVDVNALAVELDELFYRRILTDLRLSFLAESQAPKLTVFRGQSDDKRFLVARRFNAGQGYWTII